MLIRLLLTCFFFFSLTTQAKQAEHFNVLVYHHVSAKTPASTSISPSQFRRHMEFLKQNGFTVVDLGEALQKVKGSNSLPEKAVVITFDDAFKSIYENALPILREFNYPFTVFAATESVDKKYPQIMSWNQLRELLKHEGTVANHSRHHEYMVRTDEFNQTWFEEVTNNIKFAQKRIRDELGKSYQNLGKEVPKWLAYPYGEYNLALKTWLAQEGYVGFGQQSGGISHFSDFQALPRFPAAGRYANLKTLETKLVSEPLPVDVRSLPDPVFSNPIVTLNLKLLPDESSGQPINCFFNGTALSPEILNKGADLRLQLDLPQDKGRNRVNCTRRIKSQKNYQWFSYQWVLWP